MGLFRKIVIVVLLCLTLIDSINCDYYTSVSGLELLLAVENHYVEGLNKHLDELQKLNTEFQSLLDEVELEHKNTTQNFEEPTNGFKIIRRLVVDFQRLQDLAQQIQDVKVYNATSLIPAEEFTPPTEDDLKGAATGLSRLQSIYKLDADTLANGYLKDQKYSSEMSAHDCFVLGQSLYEAEEYFHASEWLIEALHKAEDLETGSNMDINDNEEYNDYDSLEQDHPDHTDDGIYPYVSAIEILEYLAPALYYANNLELALDMNKMLLDLDPENENALKNDILFASGLKELRRKVTVHKQPTQSKLQRLYGPVCSGELQQTAQQKRLLRCRYVTNNVPYYLVGPMKMEELNADPYVAHYYEVIYDSEIEQIIEAAEDYIETSKVGGTTESRYDSVRISKNSWLHFQEHSFLDKISQRLEDITGLSMETGEQLQVANYGIGGHYGPHHDFSENPEKDYRGRGNRILTALFYINEVELGGGTAFPALSLMVPPIKGSLVMWYNLHKSVERDFRTWHAGCPVLKGSKWICNEWFHALGQEFKRPCGLQPDDEISKPYERWNWKTL